MQRSIRFSVGGGGGGGERSYGIGPLKDTGRDYFGGPPFTTKLRALSHVLPHYRDSVFHLGVSPLVW